MIENAVHIKNLTVCYGQVEAISNVCLDIDKGEYLGIIGPNGGGKSTLIKAILGIVPVCEGEISIFGKSLNQSRGMIGYVPQFTVFDKKFPVTVSEVVLTGMLKKTFSPLHRYSQNEKDKADSLLEKVGIDHLCSRQISELSGGEFQRMLIARALAVCPKLLLLDEPTASVDASSREQIFSLLDELNKEMTIILVTHDLLAISSFVKRLACLNKLLVYHGEPELNDEIVSTLYGCPVDLIAHGVPHRVLREHDGEDRDV